LNPIVAKIQSKVKLQNKKPSRRNATKSINSKVLELLK
jgi:hypothetical protein